MLGTIKRTLVSRIRTGAVLVALKLQLSLRAGPQLNRMTETAEMGFLAAIARYRRRGTRKSDQN